MRILIISQYFWPESFRINEVAESLYKMGHKVDVLTAKPNYPKGKIFDGFKSYSFDIHKYKGLRLFRVPIITRGKKNIIRLALNYISFVIMGSFFSVLALTRHKYDVIYIYSTSPILQSIPGILLSKLKGIPVVLNLQDLWPESISATGYVKNKYFLQMVDLVVSFIYKSCSLILVSSKPFKNHLVKYNLKCEIKYLPNSVDPIFYENKNIVNLKLKELESGFKIVFAGNLGKAQSIDTIIGLSKKLLEFIDIKLIIFGDGSEYNYLYNQKLSQKLHNIYLMGAFPIEQMPSIFSKADVLLATLSNRECFSFTLPNKIQAYLTAKKPIVVGMNGEGARVINESKAGVAVPAENINKLFDAILAIYNMTDEERNKLSNNAFKYFQNYFNHQTLMKKLDLELKKLVFKE